MAVLLVAANAAQAQLRIASYNTLHGPRAPYSQIILQSIGEESVNGIARPIDILLLQEQDDQNLPGSDTQDFVNLLNTIYSNDGNPANDPYTHGSLVGSGDTTQTIVFNQQTVQLVSESAVGNAGSGQPRQALRHLVQPVGYDESARFYIYNSHYRAGQSSGDAADRQIEALTIRANANLRPEGTHIMYVGDFNLYTSSEAAFQTLIGPGNGHAVDPINRVGSWHTNSSFADVHTQAPCSSGCPGGFSTGGMDDRFDFQLVTDEFVDSEGLDYISGSYRAFGNGGVSYNNHINNVDNLDLSDGDGYPLNGVTSYSRSDVLGALWWNSDHLPVVADYQLPAMLSVLADSVPATLNLGDTFDLGVTVWNSAPVDVVIGADELDYMLTSSGDVSGEFLGQTDPALGGMNMHQVGFDTSTPGMKSGTITVSSNSQGVGSGSGVVGGVWTLNVMYEVLGAAGLAGDYNENDEVDAADYSVWRDAMTAGLSTLPNRDPLASGLVDEDDFLFWRDHFGDVPGAGSGSAAAVPEPSTWIMLLLGVCLARLAGGKLGAWTRRN